MSSAVALQVKDATGALVLDLTYENGWDKLVFDGGGGVTWVRDAVASPWVDGEFDASIRKGPQTLSVSLLAFGSSLAVVDGLVQDLIAAVSSSWQITRTLSDFSTTWRCRPADVAVSFTTEDWLLNRRTVNLTIPAQPNPTVTGV